MRRNMKNTLVAAVLIVAAPLGLWGLLAQRTIPGYPESERTLSTAPDWALGGWATGLGVVAVLVAGVCALSLVRAGRSGLFDPRRWTVVLPLAAAGLVVAMGHRVFTAGTADANIGAGLAVFFGTPVVAVLLLLAGMQEMRLRDERKRGAGRGVPAGA
ncbi:hypothetical protein ACWDR0_06745 [Streptomyces sp. NPDC003691]